MVLWAAAPARAASTATLAPSGSGSGLISTLPAGALPSTFQSSAPFVVSEQDMIIVPQGGALRIDELVNGLSQSTTPIDGLDLPLPTGASGVVPQVGFTSSEIASTPSGVQIKLTVAPKASVQLAFSYTVSGGTWVALPIGYPTAVFAVLVPRGQWAVRAAGFAPVGPVAFGPYTLDRYATFTPTVGALLPVEVVTPGLLGRTWVRVTLIVAVAALLLGLLTGWVRRRRIRGAARRSHASELIESAAQLDVAHQQGHIPEPEYRERRERLLSELETLDG